MRLNVRLSGAAWACVRAWTCVTPDVLCAENRPRFTAGKLGLHRVLRGVVATGKIQGFALGFHTRFRPPEDGGQRTSQMNAHAASHPARFAPLTSSRRFFPPLQASPAAKTPPPSSAAAGAKRATPMRSDKKPVALNKRKKKVALPCP